MDRTEPGSEEAPLKHAPTIAVVVNVFNQRVSSPTPSTAWLGSSSPAP